MKHENDVNYDGGMEQLAIDLGDLRYDALSNFLKLLADKIYIDGYKDLGRGRQKLAVQLYHAANHIMEAWKISEPYMS
jgi:hypothetical protein